MHKHVIYVQVRGCVSSKGDIAIQSLDTTVDVGIDTVELVERGMDTFSTLLTHNTKTHLPLLQGLVVAECISERL